MEPLLQEINSLISLEDIFGYADDILVLCEDVEQLKACIRIIENWSVKNSLIINKKKSAIVEFLPRKSKKTFLKSGDSFLNYPIVDKYKYLGCWLSSKLSLTEHTNHISKKLGFIRSKLSPILHHSSLEFRKNMWQMFIFPLFQFALPLYAVEDSVCNKEKLCAKFRGSFKTMTGLKKTVENTLL